MKRLILALTVLIAVPCVADELVIIEMSDGTSIAVRMSDGGVEVLGIFETVTTIETTTPDPTTPAGDRTLVVIHEPGLEGLNGAQSALLLDLREVAESHPDSKTKFWVKPRDQLDADGEPHHVIAKCLGALPAGVGLPFVFLYSEDGDGRAFPQGALDAIERDQLVALIKGE